MSLLVRYLFVWALLLLYLCAMNAAAGLHAEGEQLLAVLGFWVSMAGLFLTIISPRSDRP